MTENAIAAEVEEFIRFESSRNNGTWAFPAKNDDNSTHCRRDIITKHILEQLVESMLGDVIESASQQLDSTGSDEVAFRDALNALTSSQPFQQLEDAVRNCSFPSTSALESPSLGEKGVNDDAELASKKQKTLESTSAPTSFSLFDLMDSQKCAFAIPPRITAYQIIEAHKRDLDETRVLQSSNKNDSASYDENFGGNNEISQHDKSTALELLEKADDVEDLSPDPDTWKEIRRILYNGLIKFPSDGGSVEEQFRFLGVHKSLHDKCKRSNGGMMFTSQLWGLAQNIASALLIFSEKSHDEFFSGDEQPNSSVDNCSLDLYWDIVQHFLDTLTHLASDYIFSCVGNEKEIEKMILGITMNLGDHLTSCIMAMIDPMAGWFEVWARFISPAKLLAFVRATGLGCTLLRRLEKIQSGRSNSSQRIVELLNKMSGNTNADHSRIRLYGDQDDLEHCHFVQSISILRTIIFQCGGSLAVVSAIYLQTVDGSMPPTPYYQQNNHWCGKVNSAYCSVICLFSMDDVQDLLKKVEESSELFDSQRLVEKHPDAIHHILKPFKHVLRLKESDPNLLDFPLEMLCSQSIQLLQAMK